MKMLSRRAFSGLAAGSSALAVAAGGGWPVRSAFAAASPGLRDYGKAPEFAGIDKWLNSEPLTLKSLAGQVVLVDFWTYSCINCIRTLPHVVRWHEKYKDQGFTVVGVHSPEFAYEKLTRNVQDAIERFHIRYPVAQDNSFATWKAYYNQYWPAFYLVDSKGQVMRQHFGEGEYAEMEAAIEALLARKAAG
jgi:thiol-disulfide isomerase/thioredoxin